MRLGDVKPSKNFEDRTGWTERQKARHATKTLLNPVYAARNLRDTLIHNGIIVPEKPEIKLGWPEVGGK